MADETRSDQHFLTAILVVIGGLVSITIQLVYQSGGYVAIAALWITILVMIGLHSVLRRRKPVTKGNQHAQSMRDVRSVSQISGDELSTGARESFTKADLSTSEERACDPGPYKVSPGSPVRILLSVRKGDFLHGYLEEAYACEFNWLIFDSKNLAKFQQGRRYIVLEKGYDVNADSVELKIPTDGPWYLILDAYRKQHYRKVHVDLWKKLGTV